MDAAGNPLMTWLDIMIAVFVVFFAAYALTFLILEMPQSLMPASMYSGIVGLYTNVFGLWDKSFLYIVLAYLGFDAFISLKFPKLSRAAFNFLCILIFGYVFLQVRTPLLSVLNQFQFSQVLPNTASVISNNYLAVVVFFDLILCTALNLRKEDSEPNSNQYNYSRMVNNDVWQ